jgi:hypothetical protein
VVVAGPRRLAAVDVTGGLEDAWSRVAVFVPRLAAFLVVLALGWAVAWALARVLERVMRRMGSERLAERSGAGRLMADAGGRSGDLTAVVARLVRYALSLVALQLALGVFGPNPVSGLIDGILAWLPRGLVAVVLLLVAVAIANGLRDVVRAVLARVSCGRAVAMALWAVIVTLGVIAALGQAGIATAVVQPVLYAGLATVGGIAVVGVGGGLVGPMRSRWERWLTRAEQEVSAARGAVAAYRATREQAHAAREGATVQDRPDEDRDPDRSGADPDPDRER